MMVDTDDDVYQHLIDMTSDAGDPHPVTPPLSPPPATPPPLSPPPLAQPQAISPTLTAPDITRSPTVLASPPPPHYARPPASFSFVQDDTITDPW